MVFNEKVVIFEFIIIINDNKELFVSGLVGYKRMGLSIPGYPSKSARWPSG